MCFISPGLRRQLGPCWTQLFALVLGFIMQRHPDRTTAQIDSGPAPITIAAQRRELLTDLKPCLEIPIKGGAIGNTQQQWVQPVQQQLLRHWHFKVSKSPKSQHFANLSHHIDTYKTTNA